MTLLVVVMLGCRVKKKTTDRQKEKVEVSISEKEAKTVDVNEVLDSVSETEKQVFEIKKDTRVEVEGDGEKDITIERDKNKIIVSGASKVTLSESDTNTLEKEESSSKVSKNASESITETSSKDVDVTKQKNNRKTNSRVWGTSTWLWVVLLLVGLFAVYRLLKRGVRLPFL